MTDSDNEAKFEMFIRVFNALYDHDVDRVEVSEPDLFHMLVSLRGFTDGEARACIKKAMQDGLIFSRQEGYYKKVFAVAATEALKRIITDSSEELETKEGVSLESIYMILEGFAIKYKYRLIKEGYTEEDIERLNRTAAAGLEDKK